MTEDTLQTLADTQGAVLGVLENYLKLYDTGIGTTAHEAGEDL